MVRIYLPCWILAKLRRLHRRRAGRLRNLYARSGFRKVPGIVWVVVFSAFLLAINLRSVKSYGRFEFGSP